MDMDVTETCRWCGKEIALMAWKGTGFCCERHEDAARDIETGVGNGSVDNGGSDSGDGSSGDVSPDAESQG